MSVITSCGNASYVNGSTPTSTEQTSSVEDTSTNSADSSTTSTATASNPSTESEQTSEVGTRDNTPVCLVPEYPGTVVYGNDLVKVDATNTSDGYVCVEYTGTCPKVKLQITCPNTTTYTYLLTDGMEVFPLTVDSGTYTLVVFENIVDTQYSTAFRTDIDVEITNPFGPYLYPNQYVNFKADDACVAKGAELAETANTDLDVVTNIYNYMISTIKYDSAFANVVESGYTPHPDDTLASGKGICLDYSALMASMLRSQSIPTHMEVGFAGSAYHAWISVYLEETGWVNGIIEFNGTTWNLMDPTLAANSDAKELQEFIGNGSNYATKYIY